ncbi:MAG: serine hydrolase domain-containing protein [Pseudomonadota bacterium]
MKRFLLVLAFGFSLASCGQPTPASTNAEQEAPPSVERANTWLQGVVSEATAEHDLIALGTVIMHTDGTYEVAVDGFQTSNSAIPVRDNDPWHIGSNTKMLTALLYARLVEADLARWQAKLPELFPDMADEMDPAWQAVTIEDLFAHRAGLGQLDGFWASARRNDPNPMPEQRLATTKAALTIPPKGKVGDYDYTNLGYVIAGAAIEAVLERAGTPLTWEAAMQIYLFDPLASDGPPAVFGYGAPQTGPQGHRSFLGTPMQPQGRGAGADNPAALGPAGTLHANLHAHASLAMSFLDSEASLISLESRTKLTTRYPNADSRYGLGVGIISNAEYGTYFGHSGSNTMWLSTIRLHPNAGFVLIVNSNQFNDKAQAAHQDVIKAVFDRERARIPDAFSAGPSASD